MVTCRCGFIERKASEYFSRMTHILWTLKYYIEMIFYLFPSWVWLGMIFAVALLRFAARKDMVKKASVVLLYLLVSFFILHIFICKWGVRGDDERFGFEKTLTFTAYKPFAYRILTPALINFTRACFPQKFIDTHAQWLSEKSPLLRYHRIPEGLSPKTSLAVHIAYLYLFACLFFTLVLLRALGKKVYTMPAAMADCFPALGALLLPFTFIHGGYLYDFPELMLSALLLWCILKQRWLLYYPVFIAAVLNKESNALLPVVFLFFAVKAMPRRIYVTHLFAQGLIAAILLIAVRYAFAGNPGVPVEVHLWGNLAYWSRPSAYFLWFDPYLLGFSVFPRGGNIISLAVISWLLLYKRKEKPKDLEKAFWSLGGITFILFVYGGFQDEIRVFLFIFPLFYLLSVHSVYNYLKEIQARAREARV